MRYTIHNIKHESHEFDPHFVFFYFDVHFTEPEPLVIKNSFLPYGTLLNYLRTEHPEFVGYLTSVRSSIDQWGMCEHRVMEEMGQEAQEQLYGYLEEYLLNTDWVSTLFERDKQFNVQPLTLKMQNQEKFEQKLIHFKSQSEALCVSQQRYYTFCETVEKQIRQTAAEVFPELMEGSSEQMKEFKYLFTSDIISMHSRIEKMLVKQNKAH